MTEIVNFPNEKAKIIQEACSWLARMDSDGLSPVEEVEFNKWVRQSDAHKNEIAKLSRVWDNIEDANLIDIHPDSAPQQQHMVVAQEFETTNYVSKTIFKFFVSAAATLLICLSIGLFLHFHDQNQFKSTNGKYATDIGGQQTVQLSDGTEVRLNTNTLIEVNYYDGKRNIHLYKGEAHFDVAHDPEKPFTVKARKGDVRALGTVFSVRVKNDRVNVIVEEGKVRIRANDFADQINSTVTTATEIKPEKQELEQKEKDKKTVVVASAGKNVIFGEQEIESIIQEEKEEIERKFSWHQGMLAFDDEPLSDVIEEVSRYTSNKIIIADPKIRTLRVGGYYPIGKIQAIFDALELNLGLQIKKVDERTFYITYADT